MRILVTGSLGTLGKPLIDELENRGHFVFSCDLTHQARNNYMRCDISEYRQLERLFAEFDPGLVVNLAAEFGRNNGEEYYEKVWKTNAIGLRNILELQKQIKFRLIQASSSEVYGEIPVDYYKEEMLPAPQQNDYAISKWVNELQCRNFRTRYNNQIMILRFFNAYGPGEYYNNYRSVVCLFCYRALHKIPYEVYEGYHRVFMYIDDFIPTLANACERFKDGEIINIGGTEYRPITDLHKIIVKLTGNDMGSILPEDKHNVLNKRPNIDKAIRLLGHNPKVTLEVGVDRTLEWMRKIYEK
jgi:dTDP-glucose 4,6-dehydratase